MAASTRQKARAMSVSRSAVAEALALRGVLASIAVVAAFGFLLGLPGIFHG